MLIRSTPDVYEKLRHLGGMATDDVLSPSESQNSPSGWGHAAVQPPTPVSTRPPCPTANASPCCA